VVVAIDVVIGVLDVVRARPARNRHNVRLAVEPQVGATVSVPDSKVERDPCLRGRLTSRNHHRGGEAQAENPYGQSSHDFKLLLLTYFSLCLQRSPRPALVTSIVHAATGGSRRTHKHMRARNVETVGREPGRRSVPGEPEREGGV